jgi:hypothetical protein
VEHLHDSCDVFDHDVVDVDCLHFGLQLWRPGEDGSDDGAFHVQNRLPSVDLILHLKHLGNEEREFKRERVQERESSREREFKRERVQERAEQGEGDESVR